MIPFNENYSNEEFHNIEQTIMVTGDMPMSEFFHRDSNRVPQKEFDYDIILANINREVLIELIQNLKNNKSLIVATSIDETDNL